MAALDDRCGDRAVVDVRKRLGGEDYRGVLLAQGLQPFAQLGAEAGIVEGDPALIDDDQGRSSVQPRLDPVKQMGEHRGRCTRSDQAFCLEGLNRADAEVFAVPVEQASPWPL